MTGKAAYYGSSELPPDTNAGAEQRLATALAAQGWALVERYPLLIDGPSLMRFRHPSCSDSLTVSITGWNVELADLVAVEAEAATELLYVRGGMASADPPRFAYLRAKMSDLFDSLGWSASGETPLLLVVAPADCSAAATVRWPSVI